MLGERVTMCGFRRSWMAGRLSEMLPVFTFGKVLMEIAPAVWSGVEDRQNVAEVYRALTMHVDANLFPLNMTRVESDLEEIRVFGFDQVVEFFEYDVMPVGWMGLDTIMDGLMRTWSPSTAVAALVPSDDLGPITEEDWDGDLRNIEALRPYPAIIDMIEEANPTAWGLITPPPGRVWRRGWEGARDLYAYAHNATGYPLLDNAPEWEQEGEYDDVVWDVDIVRDMAECWAGARPVWNRIESTRRWIDYGDTLANLKLLAGVLTGNEGALWQTTRAKKRSE